MKLRWQIQTSKCAKQVNSVGQSRRIQWKQVVYLVSIKPLLQPELALPAEEEDELDHDDEEADNPGPGLPSTPLKLNLPPTSCLCRLTSQASLPLNGYEIAISIHKTILSLNGECVFQSNLEHLLCSGDAMAYGCKGEENIWWYVWVQRTGGRWWGCSCQPWWAPAAFHNRSGWKQKQLYNWQLPASTKVINKEWQVWRKRI